MSASARLSSNRLFAIVFVGVLTLSMAGCGLGDPAVGSSGPSDPGEAVRMPGTIYGGGTPIAGATINLYMAGSNGYAKPVGTWISNASTTTPIAEPPVLLATTTSAPYNGNFSFTHSSTKADPSGAVTNTWACPNDGSDPLIYILAVGGDTVGPASTFTNPAAVLAIPLGQCNEINYSTPVFISEVSTAAFVAAMGQYMYPGDGINPGSEAVSSNGAYLATGTQTSQSAVGLYNAFQIFTNDLLAPNTNVPTVSSTFSGTASTVSSVSVTATQEAGKLAAIADILSACVSSDNGTDTSGSTPVTTNGANCAQLFDGAAKPFVSGSTSYSGTFTTAIDILQAALYMQLNPANNTASGVSTVVSGQACDTAGYTTNTACLWGLLPKNPAFPTTLTAQPTDWTVGIQYTSTGGCNGTSNLFINGPAKEAIDASGNVWWVNFAYNSSSSSGLSMLSEMSPWGQPLVCVGSHTNGHGVTIDTAGNVWAAFAGSAYASAIMEYTTGGSTLSFPTTSVSIYPWMITADGYGNVFFTGTASGNGIYEISNASNFNAGSQGTVTTPVSSISSGNVAEMYHMFADPNGRLWFALPAGGDYGVYRNTGTGVAISKYSISSDVVTFTTATNTLAVGNVVNISGLSTGTMFNGRDLTVASVPNSTSFTAKFVASNTSSAVTDSGTATPITYTQGTITSSGTIHYGVAMNSGGLIFTGPDAVGNASALAQIETGVFTPPASSSSTASVTYGGISTTGGLNGTRAITTDGAGNIWATSQDPENVASPSTSPYPIYSVAEIAYQSGTFTALSPTVATALPSTCAAGNCITGGGFQKAAFTEAWDIAVDPSGNVWTLGSDAVNNITTTFTGTTINQIVGAAVPTVTPASVAAKNSTIATKP